MPSPPSRQREAFSQLLDGYVACASGGRSAAWDRKAAYQGLLDGFAEVYRKAEQAEQATACRLKTHFGPLLDGFEAALRRYWERQKKSADDFNLLAVLDLESDEVRHSKVLEWILNPDPRANGTHYQGNLGFQAFLAEFGLDARYADLPYKTEPEASEKESRLDIRLMSPGHFLIGIEVKIWAGEGEDQTPREWRDLCACREHEHIPPDRVHAFFLTPEGIQAKEGGHFRSITWRQIAAVFRTFAARAQPADVRLFAQHCARAMERLAPAQSEAKEE